ncbi:DUF2971 domain-containing protein [Fusibacter ferrireducens]|uniref:DUF2971 domain-containing protein n=1 Tax=Fusibacter ferrireducens TaxID=2785058 RepID=A0ABS0A012_9FIRM|nr:DUF2971 domain-containing protein [Fusibacter ferrireducens]MBF4696039.1 DUF2971 domain-containing protein [Fusibacter ferrireducens]
MNRLYAAKYTDLNDPMEGFYLFSGIRNTNIISEAVFSEKQTTKIVSLSRNYTNPLMWAHYANGHRGVAIGVEVDSTCYRCIDMNYINDLYLVENAQVKPPFEIVEEVFSNKHQIWAYEEEVRVLTNFISPYVNVIVKKVILGKSMTEEDVDFISKLIKKINEEIEIIKMDDSDFMY